MTIKLTKSVLEGHKFAILVEFDENKVYLASEFENKLVIINLFENKAIIGNTIKLSYDRIAYFDTLKEALYSAKMCCIFDNICQDEFGIVTSLNIHECIIEDNAYARGIYVIDFNSSFICISTITSDNKPCDITITNKEITDVTVDNLNNFNDTMTSFINCTNKSDRKITVYRIVNSYALLDKIISLLYN